MQFPFEKCKTGQGWTKVLDRACRGQIASFERCNFGLLVQDGNDDLLWTGCVKAYGRSKYEMEMIGRLAGTMLHCRHWSFLLTINN